MNNRTPIKKYDPFWTNITKDEGVVISVAKKKGKFEIKLVEAVDGETRIVWKDTQKTPFWASESKRKETFKTIKQKIPDVDDSLLSEATSTFANEEEFKNIPGTEKNVLPFMAKEEEEITDKLITDTIMQKHQFYCDRNNPNLPLYVWNDGVWHNDVAEGIVLHDLSKIFANEESRARMTLEKTITFIKGMAMDTVVTPIAPNFICFKNGLLDLSTMTLTPHDSRVFVVNQIPHDYDPEATCPNWEKFIGEVVKLGDIDFFQEWVGYCFYLGHPEAVFLIMIGNGQNGKTITIITLIHVLGEDNVTNISLADLTYDEFAPAELYNKLADISDDIGSYAIKNAGKLRECSGSSRIKAERKYGQPFYFKPYAKLAYTCNEPPQILDQSDAIKMRLRVVEFPVKFSKNPIGDEKPAKDRRELEKELKSEASGIINWALKGLMRLVEKGFGFTSSRSTEETWVLYRRMSNPVVAFMEERLTMTDDDSDKITIEEMYARFNEWKTKAGIKLKISRDKMIKTLKAEGIETRQRREDDRKRMYYGVTVSRSHNPPTYTEKEEEREEERRREEEGKEGRSKERDAVTRQPTLSQWEKVHRTMAIIMRLEESYPEGVPETEVRKQAEAEGIQTGFLDVFINESKRNGDLYSPKPGTIARAVKGGVGEARE